MATNRFDLGTRLREQYAKAAIDLLQGQIAKVGLKKATPQEIVQMFEAIAASPQFSRLAHDLADRMVANVTVHNAKTWREAARQSQQGRRIYDLLQRELSHGPGIRVQALVHSNASLITSLPRRLAQDTTAFISERQQEGVRAEQIAQELKARLPKLAKSRIALIARTEVGKAESAVTQVRAEALGLRWYAWATSEDQRVRPSHKLMDKVLVSWDDPPNPEKLLGIASKSGPYQAGCIFNCRCLSLPLVSPNEVSWPVRIYRHGGITRMTRSQFLDIIGMPLAA